jgi:hypothetical protein
VSSTGAPAADEMQAPAPTPAPPRLGGQLAELVFDIGAPIALYYILHAAGLSNLLALTISAVVPVVSVSIKFAFKRRIDTVAIVVLATIALAVCLAITVHSPRLVLAREGFITGLWGAWFIATLWTRRPAAFTFARPLMEGRRLLGNRSWDGLWETSPDFRRIWKVSTVIWAVALLADAVVRVVMSFTLPVDVVPGLGGALWPVTFLVIQVVTNIYYNRAGLYRILGARWARRG